MLIRGIYTAVEKLRVVGVILGSFLRRIMRRRRNVIGAVAVVVVGCLVWLMALSVASIRAASEMQAAAGQQQTAAPLLEVVAEPVEGANAEASRPPTAQQTVPGTDSTGVADGPQAPEAGQTLAPVEPVDIPAPVKPEADTAKPEPVARAWAQAFFSRPDGSWNEWETWAADWVAPELLAFMATDEFNERGALDGKQASQVTDVRVSPSDGSAGRDTPVRWSRTLEIDVQTADGRVTTVTYIIEENLTQNGWQIVNAEKKFWKVK